MMALTGCGTGLRFMPGTLHGIGFFPNNISSVVAMMAFAFTFGGAICMPIMDTVFNNVARLPSTANQNSRSASGTGSSNSQISSLSNLSPAEQALVRHNAKMGTVWAFVAILPLMWLCVLAAGSLGNVKITRRLKIDGEGRTDFSENVSEGSFLRGLVRRGTKGERQNTEVGMSKEREKARIDRNDV